MNNWKTGKLSTLCSRIGDGLHGTPNYDEDGDVFFINGNNLKDGKIEIFPDTKKVSESELKKNHIPLNSNSLLIGINGTLGNMAFYNGEKLMLGKSSAYLNFKSNINKFYYYYFQLPGVQKFFYDVATGSTIKNLSLGSLNNFVVPIPDGKEAHKIAAVLSALDDKIELNNKINIELEKMAKTLYDYWFVQFDFPFDFAQGKPNEEGKPNENGTEAERSRGYKSSGGEMVYDAALKREIPKGWEVKKLSEIAQTGSGGTPKSTTKEYYENGNIPWINSGELNSPFIISTKNFITEVALKNSSAKYFPANTILMAMYGATAGKTSIISFEATTNQAICAVMPKEKEFFHYTKFVLDDMYQYLINLSTGSARDNLSQDKIKNLDVIIPDSETLKKYSKQVATSFEKIKNNLQQNQELASLRDWLLPMLMNGQVRVGESDDEVLGLVAEEKSNYQKN